MNLAVFIKRTTLHAGYGGLETQNKALCEGLAKRGHKITVFSPKYKLDTLSQELNGVFYKFIDCSYRSLGGFGYLDKNNWINRSVEEFKKAHQKEKFDLVLGQSSAALGLVMKKAELDVPVISISHGTTTGEFKTLLQSLSSLKDYVKLIPNTAYFLLNFFNRQREFVLHSDKVVAVSKFVKKALVDETFVDENRIAVIYNGTDENIISTKIDDGMVRLFYVGLIHWSKGLEDLVVVMERIRDKNIELTVVGDGPYLAKLKELVLQKKLLNRIHILGRIPHNESMRMLGESDIFVLPSRRVEGFPMSVIEAMFAQVPVIGSNMGGIPEGVENGVTGIVYESGNVNELKNAIIKLSEDKELRNRMGKNAYEKAKKEFTLDVMLNKYEKTFSEVLS